MKKHRYSHEFTVTAVKMANAHRESFFLTMKTEWIRGRTFATFAELEAAPHGLHPLLQPLPLALWH